MKKRISLYLFVIYIIGTEASSLILENMNKVI